MSLAQLGKNPGVTESIVINADYVDDPLALYQSLSQNNQYSLLLESAEIDSKDNLSSLLLIDAALKITCNEKQVTLTPLTENGHSIIQFIGNTLPSNVRQVIENEALSLTFPEIPSGLDENSRLTQTSPFDTLRALIDGIKTLRDHPFALFLGGVFAYDYLANFEKLPSVPDGENCCPDFQFYVAETLVVIDHQSQQSELIGSVFSGEQVSESFFKVSQRLESLKQQINAFKPQENVQPVPVESEVKVDIDDQTFKQQVVKLKDNIVQGDIFQVVPSRSFSVQCPDAVNAYRQLKIQNPSPYMFYMQDAQFCLFGASPESAVKYSTDSNLIEIYPIAGTRPRGFNSDGSINADLDSRIELNLRNDEKEKAEHLMLVDLARNDVARVAKPGSRFVSDLLKVDRYSHVMHLVSRVKGELRDELDALHAYQACMNMGTLVGAPKVKAAQLIRQVEQKRRGSYGGAVGYLTGRGDMDTCIVIRSAFVKDDVAYIQAGAGVVFDSDPQAEADETRNKAQAVIRAVKTAGGKH